MVAVASNKNESVSISMDGEAVGVWFKPGESTVVRKIVGGKFAVIDAKPRKDGSYRLIKSFNESLHARRYNFAIHGDSLGE